MGSGMKTNSMMPERRQRHRILTLKNAGYAALVVGVLFVIVSVASELRDTTSGRYGRLYGGEMKKSASPLATQERDGELPVVVEATHADPMLVDSAKREAYLGDTTLTTVQVETARSSATAGSSDVAIAGSSTGIAVTTTPQPGTIELKTNPQRKPMLSGGFGR